MSVRTSTSVVAFSICRYRYLSHMCGTCVKGYGSPLPIEKKNLKEIIFFPFFSFTKGYIDLYYSATGELYLSVGFFC